MNRTPAKRHPAMTGRAGHHARRMELNSRLNAAQWMLAVPAAALIEIPLLSHGQLAPAGFVATGAAACASVASQRWKRAGKQLVGAKAEQQVLAALQRTDSYHIINGADIGVGGDADHIALTPRGIAVIEAKAGGGTVRIDNGSLITGQGRRVPGDPIAQVLRQADAARRRTRHDVTAIVCIPWMRNGPIQHRGVTICSTAQLPLVLRGLRGALSAGDAARVRRQVTR